MSSSPERPADGREESPWLAWRSTIRSHVGGWRQGQDVHIRGYRLFGDLLGRASFMQLLILNATGRHVERNLADWMEASFMCLSWPDLRIWCNRIGALAGTFRTSVTAGTVAGVLGADSRMYAGSRNYLKGMAFISEALRAYRAGDSVEEIISRCRVVEGKPIAMGYVRPVSGRDERVEPMSRLSTALGFEVGPHRALAMQISSYLDMHHGEGINIGGFTCAFLADQGFTPEEVYRIRCLVVSSGVTACYVNAADRPPESYLPMRCDDVLYTGPGPRASEEAG